jgi:hypothetical protein
MSKNKALKKDNATAAIDSPAENRGWARVNTIINTKATKGSMVASTAAVSDG